MNDRSRVLIVGVGNELRGDDAVGLLVVRQISDPRFDVVECTAEGTELIYALAGRRAAIVVDATTGGGKSGSVTRFDAHSDTIPSGLFPYSTHAFGVAEAIELLHVLDQLPERLVIYGIEGARFDMGDPLSPEVGVAIRDVARRIEGDAESIAE
jgi:hydrogenase maturation protease